MNGDYSRVERMAAAAGTGGLERRLIDTNVHVTCDPVRSDLVPVVRLLVEDLRKLPVGLSADVADHELARDLATISAGIDPDRPLRVGPRPEGAIAVHVGTRPPPTVLASAVPDGHGVRLRPGGAYPSPVAPATGLGIVLTASALAAEVFKVAVGLGPDNAAPVRPWDFDPVTLTSPGPEPWRLPEITEVTLIGCGAIGTAIARILGLLDARGGLTVVDPQTFEDPNLMTYSLGSRADVHLNRQKTTLVAAALPSMDVTTFTGTADDYLRAIDAGNAHPPRLVINGLDSIDARHEANRLRADVVIDASTGGAAGTTIGLRKAYVHGPCLDCYYPHVPRAGFDLASATGLPAYLLADGNTELTDDVIALAAPDKQGALLAHRGARVCALASLMGLVPDAGDYRPSAVFVAQQAAALAVGALVRTLNGVDGDVGYEIEYDVRYGWYGDAKVLRRPDPRCGCQTDRELIDGVRRVRYGRSPGARPSLPRVP